MGRQDKTHAMNLSPEDRTIQESQAIAQVVDRMSSQFPDVDPGHITDLVHEEHDSFAGHPIRDYVPVLVERQVKARLRAGVVRTRERMPA